MKKAVAAIALFGFLAGAAALFAQEADKEYYSDNLYITSFYTVEVYFENKKVGFLYAGVRAKIIKSTKHWLYIEYWDGRKMSRGWIRR